MHVKMIVLVGGPCLALLGAVANARMSSSGSSSATGMTEAGATDEQGTELWVCPPCGGACDQGLHKKAGSCSACGMGLVEESSVPAVAVLLYEGVDLLSVAGPAAVLAASRSARVFTVADSTDPIPTQGLGEIVPMRSFGETPPPDVLIIPSGRRVLEAAGDELLMTWVVRSAKQADHVLGVGGGGLLLAMGELLEGHEMTTHPAFAEYMAEELQGVSALTDRPLVVSGKFTTVRDTAHAPDGAFGVLQALVDEETARRTAERLGFPWHAPVPGDR